MQNRRITNFGRWLLHGNLQSASARELARQKNDCSGSCSAHVRTSMALDIGTVTFLAARQPPPKRASCARKRNCQECSFRESSSRAPGNGVCSLPRWCYLTPRRSTEGPVAPPARSGDVSVFLQHPQFFPLVLLCMALAVGTATRVVCSSPWRTPSPGRCSYFSPPRMRS